MKINLKAKLSETIILWWLFITSHFSFDLYYAQHNDKAKREGVQKC